MRTTVPVAGMLAAVIVVLVPPAEAGASSNAGIEIEFGKLKLHVYYSVAAEYRDGADEAIRDPRRILFALASAIQANGEAFEKIDHTLQVELYEREEAAGSFLLISEDPEGSAIVLRDGPVGQHDLGEEIWRALCDRYRGACTQPSRQRLYLYRCQKASCPGRIRFGSFPSESVNERFGLLPGKADRRRRARVTAGEMIRYFEELD